MTTNKSYTGRWSRCLRFETLEERRVLAVTLDLSPDIALAPLRVADSLLVNANVNNQPTAYQSETMLNVNPTNPLHLAGFSRKLVFDR